ncbi:MAG: family 16 glycoside hydrolase [Candidatus Promineifilaceae bacterium]
MKKTVVLLFVSLILISCSDMDLKIPGVSKPIFREDFVLGQTGSWFLEHDESGSTTIIPEQLLIEINDPQLVQFATLTEPAFTDFSLEVEGRILSGSPHSSYGVLFRMQNPQQFYRFEITGDGTYTLERHDADGSRTLFMGDWQDADSINQGLNVVNRLGVEAEGSNIAILVNGVVLNQVSDETYSSGYIGLDAGTFDIVPIQVAFDNLVIRLPGAE